MKNKKILLIINSLTNGGAEKAINLLAKRLKENNKVYLVAIDASNPDYEPNVELLDLQIKYTKNKIKTFLQLIKKIKKLKEIKQKYDIDISISFLPGPGIANVFSKGRDKAIVSVRNNVEAKGIFEKILTKISCKKADKVVAVSKGIEQLCIGKMKIDKNKVVTIKNTYDSNELEKKILEPIKNNYINDILENKDVIITTGRFVKQKGYISLIKSFKYLLEQRKDTHLMILGRGKQKNKIEKLIKKQNLENNIHLIDFTKNPYPYLRKSKIFICNSLFEGMSNSIIEAMAIGLPVIATDCKYGNRELIADNSNYTKLNEKYTKEQYGILTPVCKNKNGKLESKEIEVAKAMLVLLENNELCQYYKNQSKLRAQDFKNNIELWEKISENSNHM